MDELAKSTLALARQIQESVNEVSKPPVEGEKPKTSYVVDNSLVSNTRGYLENIAKQINGTYEHGWYDACAVMLRRLIETLIIEAFEHHKIATNIKDSTDNYLHLKDLIDRTLKEPTWSGAQGGLGRNTRRALPKLKDIGDMSAHSRRFNARRSDIENHLADIRVVIEEFIYLAGLK